MPNIVVVGAQWGDEGKGKVVDFLARQANLVVRFQGGPNAGHTVCCSKGRFAFHQVPSGILNTRTTCIIGCGCVVDPYRLNEELTEVKKSGIKFLRRLFIDRRAHLILPYHRLLDNLQEEQLAQKKNRHNRTGNWTCLSG